jgi:hypothetical protein
MSESRIGKISKYNTSGTCGVMFKKAYNKWIVRINVNGKRKYLGSFNTIKEANEIYQTALDELKETNTVSIIEKCKNKANMFGIAGITFNNKTNRWMARITINKKRISLGVFDTAKEAGAEYQQKLQELNETGTIVKKQNNKRKSNTSGFLGIVYRKSTNKWEARITINKKRIYLGTFDTAEEAGNEYQKRLKELNETGTIVIYQNGETKHNASGFLGVWYNKKTNKWIARITINKKRKHLGSFETAEEASKAYQGALKNK